MSRAFIALIIALGTVSYAQPVDNEIFLIDQTKPYVYLKFDHVGPRIPIEKGEGNIGLWLRVVNNFRIPIVFVSLGKPVGDPGFRLMDEVVDVEPVLQIAYTEQQKKEDREHERLRKLKHRPVGYSSETGGVVPGPTWRGYPVQRARKPRKRRLVHEGKIRTGSESLLGFARSVHVPSVLQMGHPQRISTRPVKWNAAPLNL